MSDLSKVLGDLYDSPAPSPSPSPSAAEARFQPTAPEWANEDRLDQAFEGWTPGPPADAPAAEREMSLSVAMDPTYVPAARLDDDLAASLSEALIDAGRDNHDPEVPAASAPTYELPGYDFDPAPAVAVAVPVYEYESPAVEAYAPAPAPAPARPWTRADDDVLPGKHQHVAKAPKANKAKATEVEPADKPAPKKFFGLQLRK